MRKLLLLIAIVLSAIVAHAEETPTIFYVTPDGNGNGSSWESAGNFFTITDLARTIENHQIWVKFGTYWFSSPVDFDNLFIYGGFGGAETELSQRNWEKNETIFDGGDMSSILRNTSNERTPLVYSLVPCLLDGVILQNAVNPSGVNGGAMIINNGAIVKNCIFRNNYTASNNGGALHCHRSGENANDNPFIIANCLFINNESAANGGAVQIGAKTAAIFINCTFANNQSTKGTGNTTNRGGAVGVGAADSNVSFINCIAHNNYGATLYNSYAQNNNTTTPDGGTIISINSAIESTSVKFSDGDDINHLELDQTTTPGFVAPSANTGKRNTIDFDAVSFKLSAGSICIDKGDKDNEWFTKADISRDLDCKTRIVGEKVDMGAYEYGNDNNNISFTNSEKQTLKTFSVENELYVYGFQTGDVLSVYNLQGVLLYTVKAEQNIARIPLKEKGIYLIKAGNKTAKFNY